MRSDLRMIIVEKLVLFIIWLIPADDKEGRILLKHIKEYADEVIDLYKIPYEK